MATGRCALTLLETMVVVAIVAALGLLVFAVWQRWDAADYARDLALALTGMRWRAVLHGEPVTVRPDLDGGIWVLTGTYGCDAAATDRVTRVVFTETAAAGTWPPHAIAFAPDGRPRSCSGGGVGGATIEITDRSGGRAAVVVSALGRVRWERR